MALRNMSFNNLGLGLKLKKTYFNKTFNKTMESKFLCQQALDNIEVEKQRLCDRMDAHKRECEDIYLEAQRLRDRKDAYEREREHIYLEAQCLRDRKQCLLRAQETKKEELVDSA